MGRAECIQCITKATIMEPWSLRWRGENRTRVGGQDSERWEGRGNGSPSGVSEVLEGWQQNK